MKIVTMRQGEIKALAEMFGVTTRCVNNALNGRTRGPQPERIRQAALQRGAVKIDTNR